MAEAHTNLASAYKDSEHVEMAAEAKRLDNNWQSPVYKNYNKIIHATNAKADKRKSSRGNFKLRRRRRICYHEQPTHAYIVGPCVHLTLC